jgi:hypothetical protein
MSTVPAPPLPASPMDDVPQTSAVGRMVGVIVSPKKTFSEIARRPTWAVPFVVLCLLSIGAGILVGQKTDWRSFFEHQNSKNSRFDTMSADQKENIVTQQLKFAKIAPFFGLVVIVILVFLLTLLYWGAFNLFFGAELGFTGSFGIVTYAFVPIAISSLLAIIVMLIKHAGDVDPEHILASSLSAFLPEDAPHWLDALGQSLELFWLWMLALIAIGFSTANPKKIKPAGAFLTVFGIWFVWVAAKVVFAAF